MGSTFDKVGTRARRGRDHSTQVRRLPRRAGICLFALHKVMCIYFKGWV